MRVKARSRLCAQTAAVCFPLSFAWGGGEIASIPMGYKRFPINPPHPERNCWGCDRYCPSHALMCGNGSERTQHPVEFFGPDWATWSPPQAQAQALEAPAQDTTTGALVQYGSRRSC